MRSGNLPAHYETNTESIKTQLDEQNKRLDQIEKALQKLLKSN